jgi:hypothetical protein
MNKQVLTLAVALAALVSCCKDDTNTPNGNKPQTHSYMEATINGEPWKACRIVGAVGLINLKATYYQNDGYLQLIGTDYCKKFSNTRTTEFFFRGSGIVYDTGNYNLRYFDDVNFIYYAVDDNYIYELTDTLSGWLRISEINTQRRYMSGEFSFEAYCLKNDSTITITNGKFNRISY